MELKSITPIHWLIFITCLILIQPTATAQQQTVPELDIKLFTKLPYTRQVEISPDGQHIAIIFKRDNEDMLGIVRLSDMKAIQVVRTRSKYSQIGWAIWANNKRVLYNTLEHSAWDKQLSYGGDLFAINIDGRRHKAIMGSTTERQGIRQVGKFGHHRIIDLLPDEKNHILVSFTPWREGVRNHLVDVNAKPIIYKLNINNASIKQVDKLPTPRAQAYTDNNHQVRLSFGVNDNNRVALYHKNNANDDWQKLSLKGLKDAKTILPISFSADNNKLYLKAHSSTGPETLYLYDLVKHQATKIYQHSVSDIQTLVYNQAGTKIVALSVEEDYPKYFLLDSQNQIAQLHVNLLNRLQGYNIRVVSVSDNSERIIIEAYAGYDAGGYYLYQAKTDQLNYIMDKMKWLPPSQMASREPIEFKARDGLVLKGYLTRPMGKTTNLPTVILPHGGPYGIKDTWDFDWESQLLANRGYAVLQLNFRGSGGFGYAFEKAGYGQWGVAMQNDLTDATLQLIEQGIADKKRICIYGASYGGYAALMGVIREPNLYRCAIGSVGVYNLPMMFEQGDIADKKSGIAYLKDVLGENISKQKRYSPAYNTDKIKVPLLLIHGKRDRRAPIEQLQSLEANLQANNKPYEKLILEDEGHGYFDEQNRITVYSKIIEFLDQNIGKDSK